MTTCFNVLDCYILSLKKYAKGKSRQFSVLAQRFVSFVPNPIKVSAIEPLQKSLKYGHVHFKTGRTKKIKNLSL